MAKRETLQELMKKRNPLTRTPIAPVDIYSQPPELVPAKEPDRKQEPTATKAKLIQAKPPETPPQKNTADSAGHYSTYLYPSQVKGIKLRAVEWGRDDKDIVQEAIDEYFNNHPLP